MRPLDDDAWLKALEEHTPWVVAMRNLHPLEVQEAGKAAGRRLVLRTAREIWQREGLALPPLHEQTHEWAHSVLRDAWTAEETA